MRLVCGLLVSSNEVINSDMDNVAINGIDEVIIFFGWERFGWVNSFLFWKILF